MKISELRERKQNLEQQMAQLISEFEQQTGLLVDGLISVTHSNMDEADKVNPLSSGVEVHIHVQM